MCLGFFKVYLLWIMKIGECEKEEMGISISSMLSCANMINMN